MALRTAQVPSARVVMPEPRMYLVSADADDGVLVAKIFRAGGIGIGRHRHGVLPFSLTAQYAMSVSSGNSPLLQLASRLQSEF